MGKGTSLAGSGEGEESQERGNETIRWRLEVRDTIFFYEDMKMTTQLLHMTACAYIRH